MTENKDSKGAKPPGGHTGTQQAAAVASTLWPYPLVLALFVMLAMILGLSQSARLAQCQDRLASLRALRKALGERRVVIRLKVDRLSSLDRIEREAAGRLGMVRPRGRIALAPWASERRVASSDGDGASRGIAMQAHRAAPRLSDSRPAVTSARPPTD